MRVAVEIKAITLLNAAQSPFEQTIGDGRVGVDAAVAKEGQVAADVFQGL